MRLSNLIQPSDGAVLQGEDRQIAGVTADSRQVKAGFIFVAIDGTNRNGADYIDEALASGATVFVLDEETKTPQLSSLVTLVRVPNPRHALSAIASRFYPRQPHMVAAVTGTSGKTSTVQFTRQFWKAAGHDAAAIGTLGLITDRETTYGSLTTPDPVTLHQTIDKITGEGVSHLAMEASSHGILLRRLDFVQVGLAAFTNLSRDHLDYHETMERYLAAKLRLFTSILKQNGTAVLNADAAEFEAINAVCLARGQKVMGFGRSGKEVKLLAYAPASSGQNLRFELLGKPYEINLPVIGTFQIWNSLCALSLAVASGEDPDKMVEAMTHLTGVPGRLEYIGRSAAGGSVFVDYAHKPAALENVLEALRPHVAAHDGAKLRVIFGCGGDRDRGKRPMMGQIAQKLADHVIVTDDNPRSEKADAIRAEILTGCKKVDTLEEIGDRAAAIAKGIEALQGGDVLVIAGKGHEEGQIVGTTVLPFNDAQEARKLLGA
ncbi:MAG: UDP-N-acetylmuramoyl-L-alanyl-D-glutamate--2,6-diaminopimelate ligase [Alphaproteobacteria bacterium]|nr:UDP-N-acetylmuramoyl-L-alanyl-D-glutamate--2,6-diaminopimelate ligase [Alphaproteobacteria bacterium]